VYPAGPAPIITASNIVMTQREYPIKFV